MIVEDTETAVAQLTTRELDRFRTWFEQFDGARFDQKIECDAKSGKLDDLAEAAIADFRKSRAREI